MTRRRTNYICLFCLKLARRRGYCDACYMRWRKWGDPAVFGKPGRKPGQPWKKAA